MLLLLFESEQKIQMAIKWFDKCLLNKPKKNVTQFKWTKKMLDWIKYIDINTYKYI